MPADAAAFAVAHLQRPTDAFSLNAMSATCSAAEAVRPRKRHPGLCANCCSPAVAATGARLASFAPQPQAPT
ncbi:conserved hypothetical protein [Xanthomonas citri pv. fuscans]|nr:conserved hypothetical protein [Xanthomonas citri pv. fuscans]SOO00026.1 conserved hypothetical protein [Xanthomonas citri pv. fuscans]SOO04497.1 conserved hypothetical protein [Xanthomonas citri pv. fuscans]SOO07898.1 conserved hypothetical protein [Xanthomonas citri pv. fuscans]SOO12428.1 conserved hypothetical protein [Xanthomonas citri pv. fuscans]